ncbi:type II toxin-antitoxin system VapC family toxin [Desulfonema magnum]|uniref:PIN domain-containing protein n=1 Tax=Desulfonema magnum TaxID=45655 RepID=A0A975GLT4_9BACT|nr:type II toxin-antitoxin system VapC family toxin [Desulfonema magnum]QTA85964.1 PIN domain-containing protein [Desulfonema magnum]
MKLAYTDSSVWITRIEGLPAYRKAIGNALKELGNSEYSLCISEAVLLEVLVKPYRENNNEIIRVYHKLFGQLRLLENFPDIFKDALMVAQTENLKGMDALHVSFALRHKCKCFVSTDPHFKNITTVTPVWIDLGSI